MPVFDDYLIVDWSAASERKTGENSIWYVLLSRTDDGLTLTIDRNPSTRHLARQEIRDLLVGQMQAGRRTLVGCDFAYAYPRGFAQALGIATPAWRGLWQYLTAQIQDAPSNANNRFEVAAALNQFLTGGDGPFWGCPRAKVGPAMSERKPTAFSLPEFRLCESWTPSAKSVWQLSYTGSVGSQVLMGIPTLSGWRFDPMLTNGSRVWPFETGMRPLDKDGSWLILHAEVYPSLIPISGGDDHVKDRQQVEAVARHFANLDDQEQLGRLFDCPAGLPPEQQYIAETEEGWILGVDRDLRKAPRFDTRKSREASYPRGAAFPNEGFVQRAIERHFVNLGYALLQDGYTDLACMHPITGERWVIEAKGHSASIGTDFRTCLGQLLMRMHADETAQFGLAVPNTGAYRTQVAQVSRRVRRILGLHWLLVSEDGRVLTFTPDDIVPES